MIECNSTVDAVGLVYNISNITVFECGIPGPTWLLYPSNDHIYNVILHNYLYGIGKHNPEMEGYKDPDTVNLHTHGLHVAPTVDNVVDVLVRPMCPDDLEDPNTNYRCDNTTFGASHLYNYTIPEDHYPGMIINICISFLLH